jgi:hypothetical protein
MVCADLEKGLIPTIAYRSPMPILSPNLYSVCTYCFPPLPIGTYFTMNPSSRHARIVSMSNSSSSDVIYSTGVLCLNDNHPFLSERYCRAIMGLLCDRAIVSACAIK